MERERERGRREREESSSSSSSSSSAAAAAAAAAATDDGTLPSSTRRTVRCHHYRYHSRTCAAVSMSSSVYHRTMRAQYGIVAPLRHIADIPSTLRTSLNVVYNGTVARIEKLRVCVAADDIKGTEAIVKDLSHDLIMHHAAGIESCCMATGPSLEDIHKSQHERSNVCLRTALHTLGGVEVLVDLLKLAYRRRYTAQPVPNAMSALRELCLSSVVVAEQLGRSKALIDACFFFMSSPGAFNNAVVLCEEILAVRYDVVDLTTIADFTSLIRGFTAHQLSFFSRILALVIYDPEDVSASTDAVRNGRTVMSPLRMSCIRTAAANQVALLSIPEFLPRLVALLMVSQSPATISSQLFDRLNERDDEFNLEAISPSSMIASSVLSDYGDISVPMTTADVLKALTLAVHQVEVLFILCTLLGGKQGRRVQREMTHMGAFVVLSKIFDQLQWGQPPVPEEYRHLHGPDCQCSPENSHNIKIQFLRVLHNLCDGVFGYNYKRLMLSLPELYNQSKTCASLLKGGTPMTPRIYHFDKSEEENATSLICFRDASKHQFCDRSLNQCALISGGDDIYVDEMAALSVDDDSCWKECEIDTVEACVEAVSEETLTREGLSLKNYCTEAKGLLSKIIDALMGEPTESQFRFWLGCIIETYLRGAPSVDQVLVANTGLVGDLCNQILGSKWSSTPNSLQASFDLLSEIVKFNPHSFGVLETSVGVERFEDFIAVVTDYLIDSNVFLRAVALSIENFDDDSGGFWGLFLRIRSNRVHIVRDLLLVISLDTLSQENICVLNSAIVFFVLARRSGHLADYLADLAKWEQQNSYVGSVLGNARSLLIFWDMYYAQRCKDVLSLEQSCRICFREWQMTVRDLLGSSSFGISTYLPKPDFSLQT